VSVPKNIVGFQNPASGDAYAGALCYGSFAPNYFSDFREFVTGTLSQPLTIGIKYFVSFKVSLANISSFAINNIGVNFFTANFNSIPIMNSAKVYSSNVITDSLNWILITGSFIADSNYTFITIGNHFNDSNTTVVYFQPIIHGYNAYYLFDDVCVSIDSLTCNLSVGINEGRRIDNFAIFPNPFSDKIIITTKENEFVEFILFDVTGAKILSQFFKKLTSINTGPLAKGIYIYEVRNNNGLINKGKIVKD